ncbi:MAG: hypothetical protein IJY04_00725 [Clostridia bacterium]|nr:hypothetical protein [Clostridia bacterium]
MTLYAAWIPYFTYEFMAKNEETGEFETIGTESLINLELPTWNENTGKLEMKKFPTVDGKTFLAAYLDEEMTEELTESITGNVDYEKGIGVSGSVKIYTTWREGEWFRIYNAKQFYSNSRPGGCYELMADLDFSAQVWAPTLAKGKFTGIIEGNGHKISNISVIQADISQISGGVFGSLEGARISNVTFENITYTVQSGSRLAGASFGLLCGSANDTSVLENVSVIGGKLLIGDGCYPGDSYSFGLLCGSGGSMGVDLSGITCETQTAGSAKVAVETDAVSGRVTVTFLL